MNTIDYDEKIKQMIELKDREVVEDIVEEYDPEELYEALEMLNQMENQSNDNS